MAHQRSLECWSLNRPTVGVPTGVGAPGCVLAKHAQGEAGPIFCEDGTQPVKPPLKAIRGMPRASARHGAIQMPTLNQLAGPPALNKGYANVHVDVASREDCQTIHQSANCGGSHGSLIACLVWGGWASAHPQHLTLRSRGTLRHKAAQRPSPLR
jgi:hypothetical protein